eukprot:754963-Pelagomonas_calceolata.AAC.2
MATCMLPNTLHVKLLLLLLLTTTECAMLPGGMSFVCISCCVRLVLLVLLHAPALCPPYVFCTSPPPSLCRNPLLSPVLCVTEGARDVVRAVRVGPEPSAMPVPGTEQGAQRGKRALVPATLLYCSSVEEQ